MQFTQLPAGHERPDDCERLRHDQGGVGLGLGRVRHGVGSWARPGILSPAAFGKRSPGVVPQAEESRPATPPAPRAGATAGSPQARPCALTNPTPPGHGQRQLPAAHPAARDARGRTSRVR